MTKPDDDIGTLVRMTKDAPLAHIIPEYDTRPQVFKDDIGRYMGKHKKLNLLKFEEGVIGVTDDYFEFVVANKDDDNADQYVVRVGE